MLGALLCAAGLMMNLIPLAVLVLLVRSTSSDEDHWATNYIFYGSLLTMTWYAGFALFAVFYSYWVLSIIPDGYIY